MGSLPDKNKALHNSGQTQQRSDSMYVIMSMADTTWRMFVPTLSLIWLGNTLDVRYDTKPMLLLAGAVIGGAIATLLVRRQLKAGVR